MKPLDEDRCRKGLEQVMVSGAPDTDHRKLLIEEAIAAFQGHPDTAATEHYFGIKNYAGFGDQRSDHSYGMAPRHGDIVFRIVRRGRTTEERRATTVDEHGVYLLEAVRDFGAIDHPCPDVGAARRGKINLCELLEEIASTEGRLCALRKALVGAEVESHAA